MIKGVHALFHTTDADAARAFIRDKLRLPYHDAGDGWLIFDAPEADVGCHPSDTAFHAISFYCDDIDGTIGELEDAGVSCAPIKEEEWGRVTEFELPGGGPVQLFQPKRPKA